MAVTQHSNTVMDISCLVNFSPPGHSCREQRVSNQVHPRSARSWLMPQSASIIDTDHAVNKSNTWALVSACLAQRCFARSVPCETMSYRRNTPSNSQWTLECTALHLAFHNRQNTENAARSATSTKQAASNWLHNTFQHAWAIACTHCFLTMQLTLNNVVDMLIITCCIAHSKGHFAYRISHVCSICFRVQVPIRSICYMSALTFWSASSYIETQACISSQFMMSVLAT